MKISRKKERAKIAKLNTLVERFIDVAEEIHAAFHEMPLPSQVNDPDFKKKIAPFIRLTLIMGIYQAAEKFDIPFPVLQAMSRALCEYNDIQKIVSEAVNGMAQVSFEDHSECSPGNCKHEWPDTIEKKP